MGNVSVLNSRKLKDGRWEVWDNQGRKAVGLTKQIAENQYRMLYQINNEPIGINLDQYKYR